MSVSKEVEGENGGQLYAGGKAIGDQEISGLEKGEAELVEGADGEWRAKR